MFTTGSLAWLTTATLCYGFALLFLACRRSGMGRIFLASGFLLHGLYLLGRGWLGGVFIPNPIFEGPFLIPWSLALIALIASVRKPDAGLAGLLALVVLFAIFAVVYPQGMIPPTPKKTSVWALLFFISESVAHALFYAGAWFAALALLKKNSSTGFLSWVAWGFVVYTIAQVTGALWCFLGWGNTFSWGARHLGSAAIWTFFAACLHLKFIPGWKPKSALLTIAGALLVFIVSYGNYLREMQFPRVGG